MFSSSSSSSSDDEVYIYLRRPKIYNNRKDYFVDYDDVSFFERFRLTKNTVQSLLQQIEHLIKLPTNRGGAIQPLHQLLLTLRFYASGNMQIAVADFMGISTASASRIIKKVSEAIASLSPRYIKMCNNRAEMEKTSEEFYRIARFPRVIGAIDCTLIKIDSPGGADAEIYRSRKGFFALNVQTVSDANLKITNIVARWPGSVHDQTVFNNCSLKRKFEDGHFGNFLIIGDSGYALQPYLMTKLHETRTEAENLYNESIIRTRNVVERQYGVWKRRFPILRYGMRVQLNVVMNIIVATAVLHNIALEMNDVYPDDGVNLEDNYENLLVEENCNNARHFRELIIRQHFSRL